MARHLRNAIGFLTAMVIIALALDFSLVRSKEGRLSSAVSELGGQMGSLPAWPLGTEYRITFQCSLNQKELDQLKIANRMRGWVGIAFQDCKLSETERFRAREAWPTCHIFVVRDHRMVPMDGR